MSDTGTTIVLVGAVVALARAIEWLAKASMRPRNGNGKARQRSGELDPAEWEQRIGNVVEEKLKQVIAGRNEEIRRVIREELERRQ